jgi:hypothetical protein
MTSTKAKVVETFSGGKQCIDYELSKYQGRHAGTSGNPAETYGQISSHVQQVDKTITQKFDALITTKNAKFAEVLVRGIQNSQSMSLITIRNRWNSQNVYLKDLLSLVLRSYPGMKRFHCSFCRSLVGNDNAKSSQVEWA